MAGWLDTAVNPGFLLRAALFGVRGSFLVLIGVAEEWLLVLFYFYESYRYLCFVILVIDRTGVDKSVGTMIS